MPEKLLLRETGKSLIQHTYESASTSTKADAVVVAADDPKIVAEVQSFGGVAILTSPNHPSGTDRVAEVSATREFEIIVNVQGDEPELSGESIDLAISILESNPSAKMSTLATPIRNKQLLEDPSCVKVVLNQNLQAMYFSRATIPFPREWNDQLLQTSNFFQHVGLYAYRQKFLQKIPSLKRPAIETIESLEQLRVLHAGVPIHVGVIDHPIAGIDTAEDYAAFVSRQAKR